MLRPFIPSRIPVSSISRIYLPALLCLTIVILVHVFKGVPMYMFMRDQSTINNTNPLLGVMSNLGILAWCGTAAISLFGWAVLRHRKSMETRSRFLLHCGLFTLLLMADDFFLIHENLGYFGISDKYLFMAYALLSLWGVIRYRKCILETDYTILATALTFLTLSLCVDTAENRLEVILGEWRIFFEDGFKFLGIIGWLGYFSGCSFSGIMQAEVTLLPGIERDNSGTWAGVQFLADPGDASTACPKGTTPPAEVRLPDHAQP